MSALSAEELRKRWIANAESLNRKGHFASYSPKQREEVLRRGYLGLWRPDEALRIARVQAGKGTSFRMPQFNDDIRERGWVGEEVREALLKILDETPPDRYRPPRELCDPPGYPLIFRCKTTACELFFKLQIAGSRKKPRVLFWSCHPPVRETE